MVEKSKYEVVHSGFRALQLVNEAIAGALFSTERSGLPVYLDLESDSIDGIARRLEVPVDGALDYIRKCVQDVVTGRNRVDMRPIVGAQTVWRNGSLLDTPPFLAFLAVASMAAERMSSDGNFAANAYYPRLAEQLGVEGRHDEVADAYRSVCDLLWSGLVDWLEAWEGERGLPTVTSAAQFPYVSKALSQALIRAADRARFPRLFAAYGMEPQQDIAIEDMVAFLHEWVPGHATAHLKGLWRKQDLRMGIAEAACAALRTWTGMATAEGGDDSFLVRLIAVVRKNFGRKLELSLEVIHPNSNDSRDVRIELARGASSTVPLIPSGTRTLRLADPSVLGAGDLLGGRVNLADDESGLKGIRLPRSVVPLRLDEASRMFVECDRVVLGVPHLLLVRERVGNESLEHPIANQVRAALASAARSGWTEESDMPGLPGGWTMFADVEMLGTPIGLETMNVAVRVLQPLSSSTITFSGGLQVPGAIRRWSVQRPPEITVISDAPDDQIVTLTDADEVELLRRSSDQPVMVVQIPTGSLSDGDYTVTLDSSVATRSAAVRLVSANHPSPRPIRSLAYRPLHGLGALNAVQYAEEPSDTVRGALCVPATASNRSPTPPPTDEWWLNSVIGAPAAENPLPLLDLPAPDPDSCAVTGAHYIVNLPVWTGRITSKYISGSCKTCGIVKQYPTRPRYVWNTNKPTQGTATKAVKARKLDLSRVPAVQLGSADLWDPILDALSYLRSGTAAELERLAVQVEGSALVTDRLARGLEALGHMEVELDPASLRPAAWSISPSAVAQVSATTAALTGARPRLLLGRALSETAEEFDLWVETIENEQLPSSVVVTGAAPIDWSAFTAALAERAERSIAFAPDAPSRISERLPDVSSLRSHLPRRTLPPHRKVERWDHGTTKWVPADDASRPGGYRLSGFGTTYVLRNQLDIDEGMVSVCTVQLLKHLVAQSTGRALYAYHEAEQSLVVRLGADLPGVYGRAAVMCSGRAPQEDRKQRCLIYRDVPPPIASLIHGALSR